MPTGNGLFDRRGFLRVATAAGAAVGLAACGSSGSTSQAPAATPSGSPSPSASGSPSGTPSPPPVVAGKKVDGPTMTVWADSLFVPPFVAASAGASEAIGANISFQPFGYGDLLTSFQKAGPTGNGPDLMDANIDWMGPLTQAGLLGALDFGDKAASFDKRALNGWTQDGAVYGMPIAIESLCVLRNPKLVPEPLKNWSDLEGVMAPLAKKGIRYPLVIDLNSYVFIAVTTAFGGYCYKQKPDGSYDINDIGLNNDGAVAALSMLDEAVKEKWTRPGVDADTVAKAFPAGQIGIHVTGPWQIPTYDTAKADYVIDTLPAGPAGKAVPFLSARGLVVNKLSPNAALAQSFLTDFWAGDEPMASFAEATHKQSAWTPVSTKSTDATVKALQAAAATAQPIPSTPAIQAYWPAMDNAQTLIYNQQSTPAKALATVQKAMVASSKKNS
jgi:arabinogalactan oligomer/maltooligosaccharide transport system substrate-binding protein